MLHDLPRLGVGEFARVCDGALAALDGRRDANVLRVPAPRPSHELGTGLPRDQAGRGQGRLSASTSRRRPRASPGRAPRGSRSSRRSPARPALQKLDEFDGDVPAVGSMLLLIGSLADVANASTWIEKALGPKWYPILGPLLGVRSLAGQDFLRAVLPALPFFWMLLPAEIIMGIVANPLVCDVALAAMRLPERWVAALLGCGVRERGRAARLVDGTAPPVRRLALRAPRLRRPGLAVGGLARRDPRRGGRLVGLRAGVHRRRRALHARLRVAPVGGYFLGVHRSPLPSDAESGKECQPTTSTYACLTSLSCWNLNYHVEHHDSRSCLGRASPPIARRRPSSTTASSRAPASSTIWRWLGEGHMWTYACVSAGRRGRRPSRSGAPPAAGRRVTTRSSHNESAPPRLHCPNSYGALT